jgi:hypothetical protein
VRGRPDTAELEKLALFRHENLSTVLFLVHLLSPHMAARLGLSRVAPRLLKARHVTSAIRAYATQSEHTVRHALPQHCRVLIL